MRIGRSTAVTDTGRRRLRNEDAYVYEPPLFAIADGMGARGPARWRPGSPRPR